MKYKNYYKILELNSDKVTDEDIKSAYRKLAKKYHPDANPGNLDAAEKFKNVNEAYQILSNEEIKRKYDRLHFAYKIRNKLDLKKIKASINTDSGANDFFKMFFGRSYREPVPNDKDIAIKGEDTETKIDITLEEAFFGVDKKLVFKDNDGKLKTIILKIPHGVQNNSRMRLKGQGKPGKNGGSNGDMYIKINFIEHNKFKIKNQDLELDLPISPWEAALGCSIEVQGIDSNFLVEVLAGTESGEKLRIANKGFYGTNDSRGDLLLNIKIVVPKDMSEEEKELFIKFKQISSFCPRPR